MREKMTIEKVSTPFSALCPPLLSYLLNKRTIREVCRAGNAVCWRGGVLFVVRYWLCGVWSFALCLLPAVNVIVIRVSLAFPLPVLDNPSITSVRINYR